MDSWKSSPQKMKTHYEFARLCIFLKDKQIQNGNFEWLKIFSRSESYFAGGESKNSTVEKFIYY